METRDKRLSSEYTKFRGKIHNPQCTDTVGNSVGRNPLGELVGN